MTAHVPFSVPLAVYFKCNDPHVLLLSSQLFIRNTFKIIIIETIPNKLYKRLKITCYILFQMLFTFQFTERLKYSLLDNDQGKLIYLLK